MKAKERFYQDKIYVTNKKMDTPTGSHFNGKTFNGKNHNLEDLRMIPFERVRPANNPFVRKAREKYWINNYRATKFGGNKKKSS